MTYIVYYDLYCLLGTCVKLNNLYMCRSALEQGLLCSPKHWPSIDNLVTVTFKLGDFLACLGYCAMLLELDPSSEKVILYKSKVYNEMPFLQEAYKDQNFVPIHTEIETFYAERKPEPTREPLMFDLKELTVECLAKSLFNLNNKCDELGTTLNPIDTENAVDRSGLYFILEQFLPPLCFYFLIFSSSFFLLFLVFLLLRNVLAHI